MGQSQENDSASDDLDLSELADSELTPLTETVRKHYFNYLEKQLAENFRQCCSIGQTEDNAKGFIKQTTTFMEDKALAACMIAQFYQRAMVKIIARVRRSTEDHKMVSHLQKCLTATESKHCSKETQTDLPIPSNNSNVEHETCASDNTTEEHNSTGMVDRQMTLDEKIEIFQQHLKKDQIAVPHSSCANNNMAYNNKSKEKLSHSSRRKHQYKNQQKTMRHQHHRPYKEEHTSAGDSYGFSPTSTIITPKMSPIVMRKVDQDTVPLKSTQLAEDDINNSTDSVAMQLARLFSEEKTELDEIFGIDPNGEPDDPQICKILKEIEQSKVNEQSQGDVKGFVPAANDSLSAAISKPAQKLPSSCVDLSKSLWPCELFMQRRKLSESLARLLEEDLRWYDVLKWRFLDLFGEDSDDEFTPCSPSIELDDILIGSCVKRISPWVVKHLMKPLNEGLIGNRYVFKRLAKHIARSIVMQNQYPDEAVIKNCIENYFCLHQAVLSFDDLQEVPNVSML